jgi:hypothetical protein
MGVHTGKCCGRLPSKRSVVACCLPHEATEQWQRKLEVQQTQIESIGARAPNLEEAIAWMLPTPLARDWKGVGRAGQLPNSFVPTGGGTYLNPSFVEEMMGFPVGWTALKP